MRKLLTIVCTFCLSGMLFGQVSITGPSGTYTQDFNTLVTTGSVTWTDNSTVANWYAQRTGNGTTIVANDGASNSGNLYSYGTGTATERAIGTVGSSNGAVGHLAIGVLLQNNTGQTLNDLTIQYVGEQWRKGGVTVPQVDSFFYQVSSSPITALSPNANAGWTEVPQLHFSSPVNTTGGAPLDGNDPLNQVAISYTITGLNLANGDYIMLKWDDEDHTGSDHGLAIDDVVISWNLGGGGSPLVITEINYDSPIPFGTDLLEFVEIANTGNTVLDISNYTLSGDITYTFPNGINIQPGEHLIIAKDAAFLANAGLTSLQWTSGVLGDALGDVVLKDDNGVLLDSVRYTNAGPWPGGNANGGGSSIELCNTGSDNNDGSNWQASVIFFDGLAFPPVTLRGTPGSPNICSPYNGSYNNIVINEIMYNDAGSPTDTLEFIELFNYGNTTIDLGGFYFTTAVKFTFPPYSLAPNSFVVVAQDSAKYSQYFGQSALQWRQGDLDDVRDTIILRYPAGSVLDSVLYENAGAWPTAPDGTGPSLELCDPSQDNSLAANWSASSNFLFTYAGEPLSATPGANNSCNLFGSVSGLVITEINYNNPGTDTLDFVEILNVSGSPQDLNGVSVNGSISYTFGSLVLQPNEFVVISLDSVAMQNAFGVATYQWTSGNLPNATGTVYLVDGFNSLIDSVTYFATYPWPQPANGMGYSMVLCDPSDDNNDGYSWTVSQSFIDITGNDDRYYAHPYDSCSFVATDSLVITEIMYNSPESGTDSLEFIEIYNAGTVDADLTGYSFTGVDFIFPAMSLPAGNYTVVAVNATAAANFYQVPFMQWTSGALSNTGEGIVLHDANGLVVDYVNYAAVLPWDTMANGHGHSLVLCNPANANEHHTNWASSPLYDFVGQVNGVDVYANPDTGCVLPPPSALIISEIMYNPPEAGTDSLEFVEVYNPSASPADISGYQFQVGSSPIFTIPAGSIIPANGFVLFTPDSLPVVNNYTNIPTGTLVFGINSPGFGNNGSTVRIWDNNSQVVDTVRYSDVAPWPITSPNNGPDGEGMSIVLCNLLADNDDGANWTSAATIVNGLIVNGRQVYANPGDSCVTIIPTDTTAPVPTTAVVNSCNLITVTFNEIVTVGTANNTANYTLTPAGVTINSAVLNLSGTSVQLNVSGLVPGAPYTLDVDNISDLVGNIMSGPVSFTNLSCPSVGVEENEIVVNVFPNPSAGQFAVQTNGNFSSLKITDITGKVVHSESVNEMNFTVNAGSLADGIYILTLEGGGKQLNHKIIIRK